MEYQQYTLSNGIRLIHRRIDSPVAHCGITLNTGTRDELPDEQGMAHFIEHMIFKGTVKRKAYHILSRLDDVGGDMNAYTSKEDIVIYASFLSQYYDRTLELFADIIFNSVFPEKEINKEKDVVLDEINSYKDSPSDLIFDDFEELVYADHPIGRNILGTKQNIKKFNRDKVLKFVKNNFNTDEMIISTVGNIDFEKLKRYVIRYFEPIPANLRVRKRMPVINYVPATKIQKLNTFQTHCLIGNIAYHTDDDKKTALILLNNILGGPAMNSRLNLSIREKYGFTYNIESSYTAYSDTGLWQLYFATDKGFAEKTLDLVYLELRKLRENKLSTTQLHKAKMQIIGQLAVSQAQFRNEMLSIGKSLLFFNKVDTIEEINEKFEKLTSEDILEAANIVFNEKEFCILTYKSK